MVFKEGCRGLQTMVDVQCRNLSWPLLCTGNQQGNRISTTAQGNRQRQCGVKTLHGFID